MPYLDTIVQIDLDFLWLRGSSILLSIIIIIIIFIAIIIIMFAPVETMVIGMNTENDDARLAPSRRTVLDDFHPRSQSGKKVFDKKVGAIITTHCWFETRNFDVHLVFRLLTSASRYWRPG